MAKFINIPSGLSTLGNPTNNDILIDDLSLTSVLSLKTLINGQWKSWAKDAPENFQGFVSLDKGKGYVTKTSSDTTFTFDDSILDVNDLLFTTGLNMISLPYNNMNIGDGYLPRFKFRSIKTIESAIWKSWTKGTPINFQGFTTTDINKGYVVDIESIYGTFLNINNQDMSDGIRFNISSGSVNDGGLTNGVSYTNPNNLGTFNFDIVPFDPSIPTIIMFFSIENKIAKIDFPTELIGEDFLVSYNGNTYRGVFAENESYSSPTVITDIINNTNLEITYTPKVVTGNVYKEMILNVNGNKSILEFNVEYLNNTFNVWKDGKILNTVFTEGEVVLTF